MSGSGGPPGRRRRWLLFWGAGLLAVAALVTFVVLRADDPPDPVLVDDAGRTPVAGFGAVAFRIEGDTSTSAATAAARCALLAETSEQHARGLMNRTDLAGYDGMLFRFAADTSTKFYMKDTPLPLSIAWFDTDGAFVSATDMEPCLGRSDCPTYRASAPYRYALEVPKGNLPSLGVVPGSRLVVEEGTCR